MQTACQMRALGRAQLAYWCGDTNYGSRKGEVVLRSGKIERCGHRSFCKFSYWANAEAAPGAHGPILWIPSGRTARPCDVSSNIYFDTSSDLHYKGFIATFGVGFAIGSATLWGWELVTSDWLSLKIVRAVSVLHCKLIA